MKPRLIKLVGPAFTLAELVVVIGIIVLSLAVVLPSMYAIFTAGADTQAVAAMSAALAAARASAIEQQDFALLHVQPARGDETCAAAVLTYKRVRDPNSKDLAQDRKFLPAAGYAPWRMPGGMAFGQVGTDYLNPDLHGYKQSALDSDGELLNFATFNVIFSPDGSLTEDVAGEPPKFYTSGVPLWKQPSGQSEEWLWDPAVATIEENGVGILTVFDYRRLKLIEDGAARAEELNEGGRFLVVNWYTGQLISGESRP